MKNTIQALSPIVMAQLLIMSCGKYESDAIRIARPDKPVDFPTEEGQVAATQPPAAEEARPKEQPELVAKAPEPKEAPAEIAAFKRTEFYVSPKGDDNGPGTLEQPWRTIRHAADTLQAGDTCYIRAGVYREEVRPANSGSEDKPIVFAAYKDEKPLITGCDPVSGWTVHSGNIYKATVSSKVYDVFVGENYMWKARYPNEDGDPLTNTEWLDSTTGNNGAVTISTGKPDGYWVGGSYSGVHKTETKKKGWTASFGTISASTGSTLTCTNLFPCWGYFMGAGKGYIINHLNCLDAEKEWHWENNTLYFYAPGGGVPSNVYARTSLYGFRINRMNNVTLKGLYFKGASVWIEGGSDNMIDGCHFKYVSPWGNYYYDYYKQPREVKVKGGTVDGTSGIDISGSGHTIQNCSVVGGWGLGINLSSGSNLSAINNYVSDIGWICFSYGAPIVVGTADAPTIMNPIVTWIRRISCENSSKAPIIEGCD